MSNPEAPTRIPHSSEPQVMTLSVAPVNWTPRATIYYADFRALEAQVEELTPANEQLIRFAEGHAPDDSWWEESGDPFTPEDDG